MLDERECSIRALHTDSKDSTPEKDDGPPVEVGSNGTDGRKPKMKQKQKRERKGKESSPAGPSTNGDEQAETDEMKLKKLLLKLGLVGTDILNNAGVTRYTNCLYLCTTHFVLTPT
jgi:hypothetical protein